MNTTNGWPRTARWRRLRDPSHCRVVAVSTTFSRSAAPGSLPSAGHIGSGFEPRRRQGSSGSGEIGGVSATTSIPSARRSTWRCVGETVRRLTDCLIAARSRSEPERRSCTPTPTLPRCARRRRLSSHIPTPCPDRTTRPPRSQRTHDMNKETHLQYYAQARRGRADWKQTSCHEDRASCPSSAPMSSRLVRGLGSRPTSCDVGPRTSPRWNSTTPSQHDSQIASTARTSRSWKARCTSADLRLESLQRRHRILGPAPRAIGAGQDEMLTEILRVLAPRCRPVRHRRTGSRLHTGSASRTTRSYPFSSRHWPLGSTHRIHRRRHHRRRLRDPIRRPQTPPNGSGGHRQHPLVLGAHPTTRESPAPGVQ